MSRKNILFKVDGKTLKTVQGDSVLQACFKAYIDIPRFCYHEGLRIAGNCRMCLVEVANNRKLIASCATPLISSFSVFTKTFRVKKARQAVLEFLLINHPLDCPICDQGGECDLQDITLVFGSDRGRFYEVKKRAVFDKNLGPLIKTSMNRCIHCTRCIRFFQETSFLSQDKLGLFGRGSFMEIGTYIPQFMLSELSGNVIDLCPVGALTSKPFSFKARNWELFSQYTYDIVDSFMPRVRFDLIGRNVLRILPYTGIYNSGWISNRTRFSFDSLNLQRTNSCLWNITWKLRNFLSKIENHLNLKKVIYIYITWKDAFSIFLFLFLNKINNKIFGYISCFSNLEEAWFIKQFFLSMGSSNLFFEDFSNHFFLNSAHVCHDFRYSFSLEWSLELLDNNLWFIFLLGVNLRMEAPLLFLQLKKSFSKGFLQFITVNSTFLFSGDANYQNNISLKNMLQLFEFRTKITRILLKKMLFYKFLVFVNFEFSLSNFFSHVMCLLNKFFFILRSSLHNNSSLSYESFLQPSYINTNISEILFCVIQRYVGYISFSELSLSSSIKLTPLTQSKTKILNLFFDVHNSKLTEIVSYKNENIINNILFNSTAFDVFTSAQTFSLIFPVKNSYEKEVSFFDCFLSLKKTTAILSSDTSRKSINDVLNVFNVFFKNKLKFSWLTCFFTYSLINLNINTINILMLTVLGKNKDGFLTIELSQKYFNTLYDKWHMFFLHSWFFLKKKELNFFKSFFFFFANFIPILPVINFYKDTHSNILNFSKTMQKSSLAHETSNLYNHFSVHYF